MMPRMRECSDRFEDIVAYVMGESVPEAARELETHFAACEHCRATRDRLAAEEKEIRSSFAAMLDRIELVETAVQEEIPSVAPVPLLPEQPAWGCAPTIVVRDDASLAFPNSRSGGLVGYFSQVGPFSYFVSAILMCIAVLAAWQYKMADRLQQAEGDLQAVAAMRNLDAAAVGHVSAMDACRWVADVGTADGRAPGRSELSLASEVPLGRKVKLDSGLLEITYKTGAQVILQGPATFEVDADGGFLGIGRLTGRLEKKADNSNPQSPIPNPFVIRTPTAVVTDLGTKFAVEVDQQGRTTSYVFRGAVKVHPTAISDERQDCVLQEKESAQVEASDAQGEVIHRINVDPSRFIRHVGDRRIPIEVFGTGIDVQGLGDDRHWQVVAVNNIPDFPSMAANLAWTSRSWHVSGAGQARWISTSETLIDSLPEGAACTFRTTFELNDVQLETAVLHGWFLTNGRVVAIRLNGNGVPVPKHGATARQLFQKFSVDHGFVEGVNVLEMDAIKVGRSSEDQGYNPCVAICVDFDGTVQEK